MSMITEKEPIKTKTKHYPKGAASLYVVIFTTLLLGVITMSFIRIMLSESIQTSNNDLSQSAYDSALAGIEDAKVALLKYHECLSGSLAVDCGDIIESMSGGEDTIKNCDIVRDILGRKAGASHETIIQTDEADDTVNMQQAYTCVLISEENRDYLSQLNSTYRTKIVPIRTLNGEIDNVASIRLKWYTGTNPLINLNNAVITDDNLNKFNKVGYNDSNIAYFSPKPDDINNPLAPPSISVQLIQAAKEGFRLADFDTNQMTDRTNRGTLILQPSSRDRGVDYITNSDLKGFAASADRAINNPIPVDCDTDYGEWYCAVTIELPGPFGSYHRDPGSVFLRLALLYGAPATDFSIELLKADGTTFLPFVGVQAKIDSTGRANDLFRRIEARIELSDIYFPFPEYTLTLSGADDDTLSKNFWVTKNSWGDIGNSGTPSTD